MGKSPWDIEDIWQSSYVSSYWRNGPVLNNAISGVDMALWDILGKWTGLPVYQLLGGKARKAVDTYRHAGGRTQEETAENILRLMEEGYRHIRCEPNVPQAEWRPEDNDKLPPNQRTRYWEAGPFAGLCPATSNICVSRWGKRLSC